MSSPLVSVVVPTCNSSVTLEACLRSVKTQTYSNIEIIVVDNYSTDGTRKIAKKLGAKTLLKGSERSAQMNYGVMNTRGRYIFRVDSDMVADRDIVEKCLRLCSRGADAVVVPVLPHQDICNNFWVKCMMLQQKMIIDDMVNVAPRFIKRSAFLALGGYDERIVAWEDYDLHNRLLKAGNKVTLLQDSALWHLGEPTSLKEVVLKMLNYGKTGSLGLFTKKYGFGGLKQIFIIRSSFIRHRHYFITDPLHYIGLILMKFMQASSIMLGALSRRVP